MSTVFFYNPFYFCKIHSNISDISNLNLLSFFFVNLAKVLPILLIFLEPTFGFVFLFFYGFSISFIFTLIFIISILLQALGLVCFSFSSSLRCNIRLLI